MKNIMKINYILFSTCLSLAACSSESVNNIGKKAGETAGEFFEGAGKGAENALDIKLVPGKSFASKGIEIGKTTIDDNENGNDNVLVVYLIFNANFKGNLTSKAFDDKNLEFGRATTLVEGKKGEAKFVEFIFDARTNIDAKNTLTID